MRAAWVWMLMLAACGDDLRGVEPEDYEVAQRDAYCRYLSHCGALPFEACLQMNFDAGTNPSAGVLDAIERGTVIWHPRVIRECLDRIATASCDPAEPTHVTDCDPFWEGTLHAGDTCEHGIECRSGSCDLLDCVDACCTGVCIAEAPARTLQPGESCDRGFCPTYCDHEQKCAGLLPDGAACTFSEECEAGLACVLAHCELLPGRGEACSGQCRLDGDHCSPQTNTCVPGGFIGDPCANGCSTFYACGADLRCELVDLPLGEHCSFGALCSDADAVCNQITETCELPRPNGASCGSWQDCASHTCLYADTRMGMCVGCDEN